MSWLVISFVAGVVLIVAEFFLPGMICGIVGGLSLLAGGIYGVYAFPEYAFFIVVVYLFGAVAAIVAGVFVFPKSPVGKRMILAEGIDGDADWVSDKSDESLLGQQGECFTALRPSGTIMVNDRRVDAVTNGDYIDKGATVRILEVHGNRVVVELVETLG